MHIVIKEAVRGEDGGYYLTDASILLDAEAPYFDSLPPQALARVRKEGWMALDSAEFQALAQLIKECDDDAGTGTRVPPSPER